jgi:hypothetical protein
LNCFGDFFLTAFALFRLHEAISFAMLIQRLDMIAFADSLAQSVPRLLTNASHQEGKKTNHGSAY